ncbi:ribonucleotide-diphosphate reductase subunit rnr1 [Sarracenia purpurea var. burkii]
MELTSTAELPEDKLDKRALQKGFLLEFKKDSERVFLAVAQRPDGKKNWMVSDQNGVTTSIKPQQITFIVPGAENFNQTELSDFIQKAQNNLDPSLLECAWVELLEENKQVTVNELAEMIFGSTGPLESYCAHLLLSKDKIYFTVLESKGSSSVYGPRSAMQVAELLSRKLAKEVAENEFQEFVQLLKSVKKMPLHAKPSKSSWDVEEKIRHRIKSLEAYAIDASENDDQKKAAGMCSRLVCDFAFGFLFTPGVRDLSSSLRSEDTVVVARLSLFARHWYYSLISCFHLFIRSESESDCLVAVSRNVHLSFAIYSRAKLFFASGVHFEFDCLVLLEEIAELCNFRLSVMGFDG